MCEEVCPEEAIFMQDVYSLNGLSRDELKFKKQKLYEIGGCSRGQALQVAEEKRR